MLRNRRRLVLACLVSLSAGWASSPALAAKKDAQGQRMLKTFDRWVADWGVQNASFVAMRGGKIIARGRTGDGSPDDAEPLASLSKAITGVCVAKLVDAGRLKYTARLGNLIPDYFRTNKPADNAAKNITVAELLTQSSGIGYDPTQGTADFAALNFRKKNLAEQLSLALERPLASKTFLYNNINAAALGLVVEAVTREPYEAHCGRTVLEPAGVTGAKLDPAHAIFASYGGWQISASGYARFLEHYRPATKLMKSRPAAWPKFALSGGSYYSNGIYLRESQSSYNFWHAGALYWNDPARPERNINAGSYFAMWFQDVHFVITFSPQPASGAVGDIDYKMYQAAFPPAPSSPASSPAAASGFEPAITNGTDRGVSTFPVR